MDIARSTAESGYFVHQTSIVPNRWSGQSDCVIGPFSSKTVAEYYVHAVVVLGEYETVNHRIFVKGDSWFVEILEAAL